MVIDCYLLFEFDFLAVKLRSKKSVALLDPISTFAILQFVSTDVEDSSIISYSLWS